jgi:hypothetical protein
MKHSVKVMSFVMALSVTTAMVPQASAQTQPAKTQQPAQAKQPAQAQQHDNTHSKGQGCGSRSRCRSHLGKRLQGVAAGMVVGGMAHYWQHKAERMRRNEPWSRWLGNWHCCCISCGSVEKPRNWRANVDPHYVNIFEQYRRIVDLNRSLSPVDCEEAERPKRNPPEDLLAAVRQAGEDRRRARGSIMTIASTIPGSADPSEALADARLMMHWLA